MPNRTHWRGSVLRLKLKNSLAKEGLVDLARVEKFEHSFQANEDAIVAANENSGISGVASGLRWTLNEGSFSPGLAHLAVKRSIDIVLSLSAIILLAPLFVLVAAAIKWTSHGPVLFVQKRPGLDGRVFPMLKFRSMHTQLGDKTGVVQTLKNDPRVTPLGAFLRRTSIDELPQLFNILAGHMSIVGPRPHPIGMVAGGMAYDRLVPYYNMRSVMRPGLSGWAQVNGLRGPTTEASIAVARIDHDLAYIQNFSIFLDIRIILATAFKELRGGSGF